MVLFRGSFKNRELLRSKCNGPFSPSISVNNPSLSTKSSSLAFLPVRPSVPPSRQLFHHLSLPTNSRSFYTHIHTHTLLRFLSVTYTNSLLLKSVAHSFSFCILGFLLDFSLLRWVIQCQRLIFHRYIFRVLKRIGTISTDENTENNNNNNKDRFQNEIKENGENV